MSTAGVLDYRGFGSSGASLRRRNQKTDNGRAKDCDPKQNLGLSENRVYSQTNSHLIGIMISKTIGFRGTLFSDTPI